MINNNTLKHNEMTYFTASIETVMLRFFLMMGIIIAAFASGFYIAALLALPVFISAIAAITFIPKKGRA